MSEGVQGHVGWVGGKWKEAVFLCKDGLFFKGSVDIFLEKPGFVCCNVLPWRLLT